MDTMKSFRLSSLDDPTDEQLQAIMEQVAEEARENNLRVREELDRRMDAVAKEVARLKGSSYNHA